MRYWPQLREMANRAGIRIIAGHDPEVFTRFPGRGDGHVVTIAADGTQ